MPAFVNESLNKEKVNFSKYKNKKKKSKKDKRYEYNLGWYSSSNGLKKKELKGNKPSSNFYQEYHAARILTEKKNRGSIAYERILRGDYAHLANLRSRASILEDLVPEPIFGSPREEPIDDDDRDEGLMEELDFIESVEASIFDMEEYDKKPHIRKKLRAKKEIPLTEQPKPFKVMVDDPFEIDAPISIMDGQLDSWWGAFFDSRRFMSAKILHPTIPKALLFHSYKKQNDTYRVGIRPVERPEGISDFEWEITQFFDRYNESIYAKKLLMKERIKDELTKERYKSYYPNYFDGDLDFFFKREELREKERKRIEEEEKKKKQQIRDRQRERERKSKIISNSFISKKKKRKFFDDEGNTFFNDFDRYGDEFYFEMDEEGNKLYFDFDDETDETEKNYFNFDRKGNKQYYEPEYIEEEFYYDLDEEGNEYLYEIDEKGNKNYFDLDKKGNKVYYEIEIIEEEINEELEKNEKKNFLFEIDDEGNKYLYEIDEKGNRNYFEIDEKGNKNYFEIEIIEEEIEEEQEKIKKNISDENNNNYHNLTEFGPNIFIDENENVFFFDNEKKRCYIDDEGNLYDFDDEGNKNYFEIDKNENKKLYYELGLEGNKFYIKYDDNGNKYYIDNTGSKISDTYEDDQGNSIIYGYDITDFEDQGNIIFLDKSGLNEVEYCFICKEGENTYLYKDQNRNEVRFTGNAGENKVTVFYNYVDDNKNNLQEIETKVTDNLKINEKNENQFINNSDFYKEQLKNFVEEFNSFYSISHHYSERFFRTFMSTYKDFLKRDELREKERKRIEEEKKKIKGFNTPFFEELETEYRIPMIHEWCYKEKQQIENEVRMQNKLFMKLRNDLEQLRPSSNDYLNKIYFDRYLEIEKTTKEEEKKLNAIREAKLIDFQAAVDIYIAELLKNKLAIAQENLYFKTFLDNYSDRLKEIEDKLKIAKSPLKNLPPNNTKYYQEIRNRINDLQSDIIELEKKKKTIHSYVS